jgi:hypothetical protein
MQLFHVDYTTTRNNIFVRKHYEQRAKMSTTVKNWEVMTLMWWHLVCEKKSYLSDGNQCCHLQCFICMNLILLTFNVLLFFYEHPVFTSRHSATSHKFNSNQQSRGKIKSRVEFSLFRESLSRNSYWFFRDSPIDNKDVMELYCTFHSQIL